ncbi:hypothetical protein [Actinocorallia aurantiaca]|uniref:Chitinase n=1 Tax=Actinocorallia aurantiaca TaxID=46204 RepID=A0ABP6GUA4_9ACTN
MRSKLPVVQRLVAASAVALAATAAALSVPSSASAAWGGPATLKAGKHCVKYQAILWSKNGVNKATGGRTKSWGNCG